VVSVESEQINRPLMSFNIGKQEFVYASCC